MFVAVMGYGTVGSGVVELLYKNHDSIVKRSMQDSLELKYILDIRDFPDSPYHDKLDGFITFSPFRVSKTMIVSIILSNFSLHDRLHSLAA